MAVPVVPILLGVGLLMAMKKKGASESGGSTTGGVASQESAVNSGSPKLEVKKRDINPLFNSVEFTIFWPDGTKNKYVQRRKNGPIQKMIGDFILNTKFGSRPTGKIDKEGNQEIDPMGALDIVVSNKGGKPLTAKRVILADKNVVDIL